MSLELVGSWEGLGGRKEEGVWGAVSPGHLDTARRADGSAAGSWGLRMEHGSPSTPVVCGSSGFQGELRGEGRGLGTREGGSWGPAWLWPPCGGNCSLEPTHRHGEGSSV